MRKRNKAKLLEVLRQIAPDEANAIAPTLNAKEVKKVLATFEESENESEEELKQLLSKLTTSLDRYHAALGKYHQAVVDGLKTHAGLTTKHFDSLERTFKGLRIPDHAGFFQDLGTKLAEGNKYTKATSELIRNVKWNSSMQVRNQDGSPMTPFAIGANIAIGNGSVATAGTAVQLSSASVKVTRVIVYNNDTNSTLTNNGTIVVGDSTVVAAAATRKGAVIYAANYQEFYVSDLSLLWVDALDNGAKFHFYYEKNS